MTEPTDSGVARQPDSFREQQFTVGYVPGVMPGKWFGRWAERGHRPALNGEQVRADEWRTAVDTNEVSACFVRLGWDDADPTLDELREQYRAVALYEELQVAVLDQDHILTVEDTLTTAQLHEESQPQQKPRIDDSDMAVELTAAGVGPVVLPMSIARLHHRRDVTYRELTDAPTVPVVLVWPQGLSEQDEATVQQFVGIVRGRKAHSGRDAAAELAQKPTSKPAKKTTQRPGGRGPHNVKGAKAASASKNARRRRPR